MSMHGRVDDLARLVHPTSRLRRGLELLKSVQAGCLPEVSARISSLRPGETCRFDLEGSAFYLLCQCYFPRQREEGRFEAHARHTDLHFLWSGRECIEVDDLRRRNVPPDYDKNGDLRFPMEDNSSSRLVLDPGQVAVLTPEDAHAPCLRPASGGGEVVLKMVVKIQDAHLAEPESGDHVGIKGDVHPRKNFGNLNPVE